MFRGGGGGGRGRGGNWRAGGGGGGGGSFRGGRGGQQNNNNNARNQNLNQQQQQQPQSNQNKQGNQNQQPQQQQQNNRGGGGGGFQTPQQQQQQHQNRTPQGTPQPKGATPQTTPKQATPQNQGQKQTPQQQKQTPQQNQDLSNTKSQPATPLSGLPQRDNNKGKAPSITVPPAPPQPQNGGSQKSLTPQNKNAATTPNQKSTPGQQAGAGGQQNRQSGQSTPAKAQHTPGNQQAQQSQHQQQQHQQHHQQQQHQQHQQHQQQQEQNAVGQGNSDDPNSDNTKLFIATVKQGITDKEFRELFSKFGNLKDVYLNKNKWFGLVTFETHADANSARKHYMNSTILKLKWAQSSPKETPLILNQSQDQTPAKKESSSKCRLFIGNLSPEVTPDNIRKLFEPYGTIMELFVPPGKGFGFVRYETRASAEAAKNALEGEPFANRQLQIRFASQGAVLKVRNLSPFVTNELLHQAFEPFGELERATVFVDERGKSLGEGILEFSRKPVAVAVMRKAQQECLLLTTSPLPVIIEPMEVRDDEDGFSEKMINKQSTGYLKDREKAPRFAEKGTFEYEFAMKWKELLALEKLKKEQMERELQLEKTRLMVEMDIMRYDYDLDSLRRRLKLLESRQEEFENRKLVAEKNNKARDEELEVMRKTIARRQAEILGYPYKEDQVQQQQPAAQSIQQQAAGPGNPNQQLLSGHPVADAVLGAALVVPPPDQQQPSAAAENFLKQWNSITKGVPSGQDQQAQQQQQQQPQGGGNNSKMPPGQQMPPGQLAQQTTPQGQRNLPPNSWQEVPLPPSQANKPQPNSNKPAYMSYLGQQANGKRLSDPGPVSKRRRY